MSLSPGSLIHRRVRLKLRAVTAKFSVSNHDLLATHRESPSRTRSKGHAPLERFTGDDLALIDEELGGALARSADDG